MQEKVLYKTVKNSKRKISEQLGTKEYFYCLYFILSIMLKCLYFQFTTKLNAKPFFSQVNITMLSIVIIIASAIILILIKTAVSSFICNFIISILLTSDTNFFVIITYIDNTCSPSN